MTLINVAVEGDSDVATARAVVLASGHSVAKIIAKGGKTRLDPALTKYNRTAAYSPWVVFRDSDSRCPVTLRSELLRGCAPVDPQFVLRIAHSMTEAWLLGDADGFAAYFAVPADSVPADPETVMNAKTSLLTLVARSRRREIRDDMVRNGRPGPLYTTRINDYASSAWRVDEAQHRCESLRRAVAALTAIP